MTKSELIELKETLEDALEYVTESLVNHDYQFGRTTRKNQIRSALIEADIKAIERKIEMLNQKINEVEK